MVLLGIFLAIFLGFLFINIISPKFNLCEKIGLSFPLGIFWITLIMLLLDMVNIPLVKNNILAGMILLIVASMLLLWKKYKVIFTEFINSFKISIGSFNLIWLIFIIMIIYIENMNFQKCMFWPPFDQDSLWGFDSIGFFISKEFTFKDLSIFQEIYNSRIHRAGSIITYSPLVQLSYAFVYLFGAETSKIIPALMFASFLLAFYGVSKRVVNKTGAAIITFFVLITPEMLAFSSLSITNVIHAVYASIGIIYFVLWLREKQKKDLILSAVLLAINFWTRKEGLAFIGATYCVIFIDVLMNKNFKEYIYFVIITLSTFIVWTITMKIFGFYSENEVITKPYWDAEKISTIWRYMIMLFKSTLYYGITFIVFLLGFLGNLWFLIKKRNNIYLLSIIILAIIFYCLLLYHIEYKWDSIENVLMYSAKRFLFCFIPLLWFYVASNDSVLWLLNKTELFLSVKNKKNDLQ